MDHVNGIALLDRDLHEPVERGGIGIVNLVWPVGQDELVLRHIDEASIGG